MAKIFNIHHSILRIVSTLSLALISWTSIHAQQFVFKFTSNPDAATVSLNGKVLGTTPFEAKFEWPKSHDSIVFLFHKDNYEDGEFVVPTKPKYKDNFKNMKLEKVRPRFELDATSVLVNFDKLMTEFPLGKIVGHNKTFYGGDITWDAYSRVGVQEFVTKADDVLGSAGFRTPFIKGNELFSDQETRQQSPRFLIGGKVTDIWVGLGPSTLIGINANNWCTIEWKVFDKALNKVVLVDSSRGEFVGVYTKVTELNVMMDLFQDGLESFLLKGGLYTLVANAGADTDGGEDPIAAKPMERLNMVSVPAFENMPAMIQYATKACATVKSGDHFASGVVLSESGRMVTTARIAQHASPISVVLSNGVELEAKIVLVDVEADLALLQVGGAKFQALPAGKGFSAGLGEEIVTIGTPKSLELGQSVGKGIVSGKSQAAAMQLIQTDMAVSQGNVGGPLINKQGQLIGIIHKIEDGKAVAIPIETALKRLGLKVME